MVRENPQEEGQLQQLSLQKTCQTCQRQKFFLSVLKTRSGMVDIARKPTIDNRKDPGQN